MTTSMNKENSVELDTGNMVKHGLFLSLILAVANIANFFFHVSMGHMLDAKDYGILMTILSLLYIYNVPAETMRLVMTYHVALNYGEGGARVITSMFFKIMQSILKMVFIFLLIVGIFSPVIARFFLLETPIPVLISAIICVVTLLMTTSHGVLQGTQDFKWYGISAVLWFGGRLVCAIVLVLLGMKANGALLGIVFGTTLALIVAYNYLRKTLFLNKSEEHINIKPIFRYGIKVMIVYAAFMILGNIDVLVIKHHFSPEEAGRFSQAALLTHFLWLIPLPISMAMFPKVVICKHFKQVTINLLIRSMILVFLATFSICLIIIWQTPLIFGLVFGDFSHPLIPIMPIYVWSMFPLAIIFILLNYLMAYGQFKACWPVVIMAIALTITLGIISCEYKKIITILLWSYWSLLILMIVIIFNKLYFSRNCKFLPEDGVLNVVRPFR